MMCWRAFLLLAFAALCMCPRTSEASPAVTEVFIATATATPTKPKALDRRRDARSRSVVKTATDAAIAINSVEFMDLLATSKDSADIRTFTQSMQQQQQQALGSDSTASNGNGSLWRLFRGGDDTDASNREPIVKGVKEVKHTSHETVTEYVGRLWFLPESKGGFRFRETIRVLSTSHDGRSSSVECTTQYQKGSKWVDCSKVICNFSSLSHAAAVGSEETHERRNSSAGEGTRVKMSLDSELLVWLPLPKMAARAVGKKISTAFESAALDFFEGLASYY